jgi:hypothetical protein
MVPLNKRDFFLQLKYETSMFVLNVQVDDNLDMRRAYYLNLK